MFAAAIVLVVVGTGCSEDANERANAVRPELPGETLADLVAAVGPHSDYEIIGRPNELATVHDVAVEGRIATVEAGRTQMADFGEGIESVVFGIDIIEEYKADPGRRGNLVYFELLRPDNVSADEYRERIGIDTTVIFLGYRAPTMTPVENEYAGRESGSSLYQPSAQGLFVLSTEAGGSVEAATADSERRVSAEDVGDGGIVPVMEGPEALPVAWRDLSETEIRGDLRAWQ